MAFPNDGKKFKPGESGNPDGRPKGVPNTKTRLQRLLKIVQDKKNPFTGEVEGFSVAEQMDMAMILNAVKGDSKSYQALIDRLEGKPKQQTSVEITKSPAREVLEAAGLIEVDDDGKITTDT
jgi:hypothetical protein